MNKTGYFKHLKDAYESLNNGGSFLTVQTEDELNTMTIGWASIGIIWRTSMFLVLVRHSRYTHKLIEKANDFTVSFPFNDKKKEELIYCGTKSGEDYDKFKELNIKTIKSKYVSSPLIKGCDLYYECNIKHKQNMKEENIYTNVLKDCYPKNDLHTLYFGEIVNCLKS